jgi:hypothetical protein
VPGRQADGWDVLANGLGIAAGLGLCVLFLWLAPRRWQALVCGG